MELILLLSHYSKGIILIVKFGNRPSEKYDKCHFWKKLILKLKSFYSSIYLVIIKLPYLFLK